MNKVFQLELCPEDAQRIINALQLLRSHCQELIDHSDTQMQKDVAWIEWSYVSELLSELEAKFELDVW
jgi:hypothetical protein